MDKKRFHCNVRAYSYKALKIYIQSPLIHTNIFLWENIYILYLSIPSLCMLILIILVCFLIRFTPNICEDFYFTIYDQKMVIMYLVIINSNSIIVECISKMSFSKTSSISLSPFWFTALHHPLSLTKMCYCIRSHHCGP